MLFFGIQYSNSIFFGPIDSPIITTQIMLGQLGALLISETKSGDIFGSETCSVFKFEKLKRGHCPFIKQFLSPHFS